MFHNVKNVDAFSLRVLTFSVLENRNNIYLLVHSFHEVLFICFLSLPLTTNNAVVLSWMNGSSRKKKVLKSIVTGETSTSAELAILSRFLRWQVAAANAQKIFSSCSLN